MQYLMEACLAYAILLLLIGFVCQLYLLATAVINYVDEWIEQRRRK